MVKISPAQASALLEFRILPEKPQLLNTVDKMDEGNLMKSIMLAVGRISRIFRNNVGTGWQGQAGPVKKYPDGTSYIVLKNPRPLRAGLCVGSSDLIGWTEKEITPEMVGRRVAIFTALEVKTPTGRASKEQINFIRVVREAGGIAGIARDGEEGVRIVTH
jgi:hypothetical protein